MYFYSTFIKKYWKVDGFVSLFRHIPNGFGSSGRSSKCMPPFGAVHTRNSLTCVHGAQLFAKPHRTPRTLRGAEEFNDRFEDFKKNKGPRNSIVITKNLLKLWKKFKQ